ncbi:mitochondrial protein Pet127-domain-containing protein [Zopfochytrium polystomum]|nr:mitochondrial protein Pet127-domain-containing protein [Zopfochytrium polystomum]
MANSQSVVRSFFPHSRAGHAGLPRVSSSIVPQRYLLRQGHCVLFSSSPAPAASKRSKKGNRKELQEPVPIPRIRRKNLPHSPDGETITIRPTPFLNKPVTVGEQVVAPKLAHGLERVLFNPGVHFLRDPRSGVYNFNPWLSKITQPEEFNFQALNPYITASKDQTLVDVAEREDCRYASSTSSITNLLSKMHQVLFLEKGLHLGGLSSAFSDQPANLTGMSRKPTSALLYFKNGRYVIDQEKSEEEGDNAILMTLGHSMEKMLTLEPQEFNRYLKSHEGPDVLKGPEAYHFATIENFMLRSQLDCQDDRLPRQTFDLKTRASLAVRMDPRNFLENSAYTLTAKRGLFDSFEREYYDMMRSAFLKYSLQVRIGAMDGIFVCYHNTQNIFGFEYVPLEDMAVALCGSVELGDGSFALSVKTLERLLDVVTKKYWGENIKLTFGPTRKLPVRITCSVAPRFKILGFHSVHQRIC